MWCLYHAHRKELGSSIWNWVARACLKMIREVRMKNSRTLIDILIVNFWWNTTTQPCEEGFSKMRKRIMVRLHGCQIGNFPYIF
jgi:hypothetical protein